MESLEELKAKYKLSDEEHDKIFEQIKRIMLFGKHSVPNPKAIIDIAPPGSGKTGLNIYGARQFIDNNVVIINSDEIKPFHPKVDEIARLYPQYFTKVTDQESNTWTSDLFNYALANGYNVIFEGTGKNTRILDTIREKMSNYDVTVRCLTVNEINCLISILERYEGQVQTKGYGRLVTLDHFYETYNAITNTMDAIEESGIVDHIEVFKRGLFPDNPLKIYEKDNVTNVFDKASSAISIGREKDACAANQYFNKIVKDMSQLLKNKGASEEEIKIFQKIVELNQNYEQTFNDTCGKTK